MATPYHCRPPLWGRSEICSGNEISTSLTSWIPISMDEDGCPLLEQPFPSATSLMGKLALFWKLHPSMGTNLRSCPTRVPILLRRKGAQVGEMPYEIASPVIPHNRPHIHKGLSGLKGYSTQDHYPAPHVVSRGHRPHRPPLATSPRPRLSSSSG